MKTITIKLIRANSKTGPFTIMDQFGNVIASDVAKSVLIRGISYSVNDDVAMITLSSTGKCSLSKTQNLTAVSPVQLANTVFTQSSTACLWRHLVFNIFNSFYGVTEPYVIEYPFSYQYQDQILQSVQDYTRVYKYLSDGTGVFSYNNKLEVDDIWFNKAVLYNNQQSSGTLLLIPKPVNNLKEYMRYPLYNVDSKSIIYTKSDNFYQYNTVWSIVKDRTIQLFTTSCESLSIDKQVNDSNMTYTQQSFNKSPLRAKDCKIRHILDNRSDVHLVSQFILVPSQISYK